MRDRLRFVVCIWTAWAVAFGGCRTPQPTSVRPLPHAASTANPPPPVAGGRPTVAIVDERRGALTATLGTTGNVSTTAPITALSKGETEALLARLEPLPAVDNHAAPTLRPASAPPPRVGGVTPIAFVRPTGKQVADSPISQAPAALAPLAAPQILPMGEVRAESEIRVRFDEPMIAIAAIGSARADVATITPNVVGSWRWIDTRVAVFTTKAKRFPAATQFTITVKPGLKSISGSTLQSEAVGTFVTPPVMLTVIYPHSRVRPDSPLLLEFDQDIDQAAIAKLLRVEDGRKRKLPFKTITLDAAQTLWAKNPSLADDKPQFRPHYLVIAPATEWPAGIDGRVVLAKNAPSQEGPRLSSEETDEDFSVARTFETLGLSCQEMKRPSTIGANCPAWSYLQIQFSNPIDATRYHAKLVQIEGEPLQDHIPYDDFVGLETPHDVGKDHAVVIGPGITDIYGQPLFGAKRLPFKTTPEVFEPYLYGDSGLYMLDPRFGVPQWNLHAQAIANLHVTLYQVEPRDYYAFQDYEEGKRAKPPGKQVFDQDFALGKKYGGDARIDLRPALRNGTGHVIAIANGGKQKLTAWIEVTKLALTSRIDGEHVHTFVQDVSPAAFMKPITNATTSMIVDGRSDAAPPASTDGEGHAMFDLLAPKTLTKPQHTALLLATAGDDSVFAPLHRSEKTQRVRDALWYVTDDRFTYKPGETVYVKGWVRWTHNGINPRLALPAANDAITYALTDARGNKVASGTAKLTNQGGFDVEVQLPSNVNLGTATFSFETQRESHRHPISIEEFRTPAYAVNLNDDVSHAGATPLVVGESIDMTADAKYYAGGGLAGARIVWDATLTPATYRPAGWDRYRFSPLRNWWRGEGGDLGGASDTQTTTLSGSSASSITYGLTAVPSNVPSILAVDATVTDIDRQTIRASSRKIVVHPSTRYVGLRLQPDTEDVIQAIVTDIDGNAVAGVAVDVTIEGVLGSERGRGDAEVVDTQHCKLTSAAAPVTCSFHRKDWQYAYAATAVVADSRGRQNSALLEIPWWASRDRDFDVVADKPLYKPGDIAKLTLRSKTVPATMYVTFARQGVLAQKRVEMTSETATVELPIDEAYVENVSVIVDRIAKREHQQQPIDPPLPEHQHVDIDLAVDVEAQRLTMRTRPLQSLVEPGDNATFEVEVKHDDRPLAGAEVALVVVDEAVLAVSGKTHADPLEPFYRKVDDGTTYMSTHAMIRDAGNAIKGKPGFERWRLDTLGHGGGTGSGYGFGSGRGGMSGRSVSAPSVRMGIVKSRKDFRATAVFSPTLITDEHGKVNVTVKMPDSLTRFRIVALATGKTGYFGKAENNIVTQRKINARTVAPRFLNQGDTFSLPVVVQNLDRTARTIDVAVRAANLESVGDMGKRVVVPGGQRAEVRFDFATTARGKAVIQTIVQSGNFADASNVELPVYEPATTESFATYGSITDKPHFERLEVPADVFRDVGGVQTELASTQLQELTDAYWYLYAYPFECAEQRSARMLATTAIYDILDAFATPGRPTKQEIADQRALDLQKLTRDQLADGGWGYFRGMKSDPFVTMQVLTALGAQHEKGAVITKATAYVTARYQELVRHKDKASIALAAAALTSLASTGTDVSARAAQLHALAQKLHAYPIDARARVLAILAKRPGYKSIRDQLVAALLSSIHETASAANVAVDFTEGERLLLVSSTKSSALVLDALLRESPDHALVAKLARGILDARKRGRWISTQENLFVLQAMRRYFDNYEKDTPNYMGKVWLGTAAYTEQSFVGRSSVRANAELGWDQLGPGTAHDITMQKTGPGRMYFRIGITYAPKQTNLPPLDAGFVVRREYKAVDDPSDVVKLADGSWQIKLGARVLVTVESINTSPRHGVAVVDPLPAGFEAVNTRLATSERAVVDDTASGWDYTNMRDNRSEVFSMYLGEGSHRFSYTARATIPGRFLAAPAKAEEMYNPETFGRSGGAIVVVR